MRISDSARCSLVVCATSDFQRYALSWCAGVAILLLAGCGGSTPLNPSPAGPSTALRAIAAKRAPVSVAYGVLYNFEGGGGDGYYPYAGLTNIKGTFYSTTQDGGVNFEGAVFSVTPSGTETMLHSFGGSGDGTYPFAGLINVHGTLYGTTETGGANSKGTVFSITPSGAETVLHSFGGSGRMAHTPARVSSMSRAHYTARPTSAAQTTLERSFDHAIWNGNGGLQLQRRLGRRRISVCWEPHQRKGQALRHDR